MREKREKKLLNENASVFVYFYASQHEYIIITFCLDFNTTQTKNMLFIKWIKNKLFFSLIPPMDGAAN